MPAATPPVRRFVVYASHANRAGLHVTGTLHVTVPTGKGRPNAGWAELKAKLTAAGLSLRSTSL